MGMKFFNFQLADISTGKNIGESGGVAYVAEADGAAKVALFNADGSELANPVAITGGKIEFYTTDELATVDIYGMAPTGHGFKYKGMAASGPNEIYVNTQDLFTEIVIPCSVADTTANVETDSGFDLPDYATVNPMFVSVDVLTVDATEALDAGLLSTEASGDSDGFLNSVSLATAGHVQAQSVVTAGGSETYFSSTTRGDLVEDFLAGSNTATDTGISNPKSHVCDGTTKSISYTFSAGTDTAEAFIRLGMELPLV